MSKPGKLSSIYIYLSLAFMLVLAGCVAGLELADPATSARYREMSPPPGQALVYVLRADQPAGRDALTRISLDGEGFATLGPGSFALAEIAPGGHVLETALDNRASLGITVKAGQICYVLASVTDGEGHRVSLKRLSPPAGRELLGQYRMSLTNHILPQLD